MTSFLQKGGPAFAAGFGLSLIVLAFLSRGDVFIVSGSILFGAAIIAAQLAKLVVLKQG